MDQQEDFDMMPDSTSDVEEEYDPNNPDEMFAFIQRSYLKTLSALEEDPANTRYIEEFTKIFDYLRETKTKADQLSEDYARCEIELAERTQELSESNEKLTSNESTILELTNNVNASQCLIDNAHAREQQSQEVIDSLRQQMATLRAEIAMMEKLAEGDLIDRSDNRASNTALERERLELTAEVAKLSENLNNALIYQEKLEMQKSDDDTQLMEVRQRIEENTEEIDKLKKSKQRVETLLEQTNKTLQEREKDFNALNKKLDTSDAKLKATEQLIKENTVTTIKCHRDLDGWSVRYKRLRKDYDHVLAELANIQQDNITIKKVVLQKDKIISTLTAEKKIMENAKDRNVLKCNTLGKEAETLLKDKEKNEVVLIKLEKDIKKQECLVNERKRVNERLKNDANVLNRSLMLFKCENNKTMKELRLQEKLTSKMQKDLDDCSDTEYKHELKLQQFSRENNRITEEVRSKEADIQILLNTVRAEQAKLSEVQKQLFDRERRLCKQLNLYEANRKERNSLVNDVKALHLDQEEAQTKLKHGHYEIEVLKDQIVHRDRHILGERTVIKKLSQERDSTKLELQTARAETEEVKQQLLEIQIDRKRLCHIIQENDKSIKEQSKTISTLYNERESLNLQLMSRQEELTLMNEKVKLQQTILGNGEIQYGERLRDIQLLKLEVKRLRQSHALLTTEMKNSVDLRLEVFHLERDLTKERLKNKALEEEMQTPMNIHRWRKLEGSDPKAYDLLQKVTLLQKKLLKQQGVIIEKDKRLEDFKKLYRSLQRMLEHQPGPNAAQQMVELQRKVASARDSIMSLKFELTLYEQQSETNNELMKRANQELNRTKRNLLNERRKRAKQAELLRSYTSMAVPQSSSRVRLKYTGGGFRMAVSASSANIRHA